MGSQRSERTTGGWRRHTRGWQSGLVVLLVAGSAIVFVTPRPVSPQTFPSPSVSGAALERVRLADEAAADSAERERLDVDVRRLGSAFRAYNLAVAEADPDELVRARGRVLKAAAAATARSVEQTVALRAYQMRLFLRALQRWEQTGKADETLRALGGDFVDVLRRSRWCEPDSFRLRASSSVLRALFKKRFNDLTGLSRPPFSLSPEEDRLRYGFLIEYPFVPAGRVSSVEAVVRRRQALSGRLSLVDKLAQLDPGYPADLARGVLFFQAHRYVDATGAYRRWLSHHPDGPNTLRVRNYLSAAMLAARERGF